MWQQVDSGGITTSVWASISSLISPPVTTACSKYRALTYGRRVDTHTCRPAPARRTHPRAECRIQARHQCVSMQAARGRSGRGWDGERQGYNVRLMLTDRDDIVLWAYSQ